VTDPRSCLMIDFAPDASPLNAVSRSPFWALKTMRLSNPADDPDYYHDDDDRSD